MYDGLGFHLVLKESDHNSNTLPFVPMQGIFDSIRELSPEQCLGHTRRSSAECGKQAYDCRNTPTGFGLRGSRDISWGCRK